MDAGLRIFPVLAKGMVNGAKGIGRAIDRYEQSSHGAPTVFGVRQAYCQSVAAMIGIN
jgi:hypothetical protein